VKILGSRGLPATVTFRGTEISAASRQRSRFALAVVVFALFLIGAGVSGCRGTSVEAKAFIGNGGDLYIDIPKAKEHRHTVLYEMSVSRLDSSGHPSGTYWSVIKYGNSSDADVTVFPLRYGSRINGVVTETPAKKLTNGSYVIWGFVKFFDSDELGKVGTPFEAAQVYGRFEYEDGVARNLTSQ
jgi:hypothetical protein